MLRFTVDGRELTGHPGDTVASAMLANGVVQVAPSIYRGRPRGIVAAGVEEPNALVRIEGSCSEGMLPATAVELYDGLSATTLSGRGGSTRPLTPPSTTRSTSTPTSWSSAPDRPGSRPPPLPRAPGPA
ncbi:hypothetical protein SVIO_105850 [Streptomyces violaceusniger]|uniref:Uncharacterized protein n=1 Tax=Streptomyces violaceusniger TaxID=68280 RepID=A0A4D4LFB3_STRVO|nr:hypothetical protein SVIO_105850 [Streptomyces violaceusniger]